MAAINWNSAGKTAWRPALEIHICLFSNGSRNASNTLRWNSGNSSKNKTP